MNWTSFRSKNNVQRNIANMRRKGTSKLLKYLFPISKMALSFFDAILESKHYNSIYIKYAVYCFKPILIKRIPKLAIELLYINHLGTSRDKTKHTHFQLKYLEVVWFIFLKGVFMKFCVSIRLFQQTQRKRIDHMWLYNHRIQFQHWYFFSLLIKILNVRKHSQITHVAHCV